MKKNNLFKKIKATTLICTLLVSTFAFIGCGDDDTLVLDKQTTTVVPESENPQVDLSKVGYVFYYNETPIYIGEKVSEFYDKLGVKPSQEDTSQSCMYDGNETTYQYTDFNVTAYEDGDDNTVFYILLTSDLVSTKEGIKLGDSVDKVVSAYGQPNDPESYKYQKDNMSIAFALDADNNVMSISYMAAE